MQAPASSNDPSLHTGTNSRLNNNLEEVIRQLDAGHDSAVSQTLLWLTWGLLNMRIPTKVLAGFGRLCILHQVTEDTPLSNPIRPSA